MVVGQKEYKWYNFTFGMRDKVGCVNECSEV